MIHVACSFSSAVLVNGVEYKYSKKRALSVAMNIFFLKTRIREDEAN